MRLAAPPVMKSFFSLFHVGLVWGLTFEAQTVFYKRVLAYVRISFHILFLIVKLMTCKNRYCLQRNTLGALYYFFTIFSKYFLRVLKPFCFCNIVSTFYMVFYWAFSSPCVNVSRVYNSLTTAFHLIVLFFGQGVVATEGQRQLQFEGKQNKWILGAEVWAGWILFAAVLSGVSSGTDNSQLPLTWSLELLTPFIGVALGTHLAWNL